MFSLAQTPPRKSRTLFSSTAVPTVQEAAELAQGLTLAGSTLEAPRFHKVNWRSNQVFKEQDDPDRTTEPWETPAFVLEGTDPIEQRSKTVAEDIPLKGNAFARIVRGVLDEEDCAALLASVNLKGFTPALLNIGGGRQRLEPTVRDGHRVIVDSPELTDWLFKVLEPHLPSEYNGRKLVDLNERCRFLCYTPGQSFSPHYDGQYRRPQGHSHAGDESQVTIQLYLHDVPSDAGGATNILDAGYYADEVVAACQPEAGSVLLFAQDQVYHEGAMVTSGLKYTLRTEAMYRRQPSGYALPMGN